MKDKIIPEKNNIKFQRMNLSIYTGRCIGLVNGKIVVNEKNPSKAMERVLQLSKNKNNQVALICVPSDKTTMVI